MDFRLLGRLQVVDAGDDLTPTRPKQRSLLALLLLRAGELVAVDEAVEALWGERPPPASRNAVHGHVAALRRLLGPGRIETHGSAYLLRAEPGEVDAHCFERLLTDARGRTPRERARMLAEALDLFRGAPLEDFRYDDFAAGESARIDELRMLALEERLEADLELGRHEEVVAELDRLVREAPLRERLHRQLMLALYRSGRQSHALEAYRHAGETLRDRLGLEPGPELRRLERQILNQDPELDLARSGRSRLPAAPTPLLGRDRELAEARTLLLRSDVRVLTFVGPAGTGKTRLALEVARAAASHFPDGAFFVPLAPLADASLVLPTIARALDLRDTGARPAAGMLAAHLAAKKMLVFLDNFEHLIDAAPALVELVEKSSPGMTFLVTSRAPLRFDQEHVYRVPPLHSAAATLLFVERAHDVCPDLDRTDKTVAAVAEICRGLDRLPLAIEIAAARMATLSPHALLARLSSRLDALVDRSSDRPVRQQSLRATLAWSYDLLDAPEQRLFASLAVFAGGWTVDAADAVCGSSAGVVGGLSSLADKSLLTVEAGPAAPRFSMLETIREYAAECLAAAGGEGAAQRRHADFFLALAEESEPHLRGSPGEWLQGLEREHDNLRITLGRLTAAGETQDALRLTGALWRFWYLRGHLSEGRQRLEGALGADERPGAPRARALLGAGVMAVQAGDPKAVRPRAEEAVSLHRELGDAWGSAYAGLILGYAAAGEGDRDTALQLYERAVASFRQLGDEHSSLLASRNLAWAYDRMGAHDRARSLHEANLRRARASGNARIEASTLAELAMLALREGRADKAMAMLKDSLRLHGEHGDVLDMSVDLCRLAAALARAGRHETATSLLAAFTTLGDAVGIRSSWVAELNEETLALVRDRLDDVAFAEAWAEGAALTPDEAVSQALAEGG